MVKEDNWGNDNVKYFSYDIVGNKKVDDRMLTIGVSYCGRMKRDFCNRVVGVEGTWERNVIRGFGRLNGVVYVVEM